MKQPRQRKVYILTRYDKSGEQVGEVEVYGNLKKLVNGKPSEGIEPLKPGLTDKEKESLYNKINNTLKGFKNKKCKPYFLDAYYKIQLNKMIVSDRIIK